MRTTIETERLSIHPGQPGTLDIDVVNNATVIDGMTASIEGIDPAYVRVSPPVVTLFPEAVGRLTVTFDVPKTFPSGDAFLNVKVVSTVDRRVQTENAVWMTVDPVEAADMVVRPSLVVAGAEARFGVEVTNTGNVATDFTFQATEPTRELECRVVPSTATVPPNQSRTVYVFARGKRPLLSQIVARTIQIEATSPTLQLQQTARFNQKPRIPRGVITAVILASIIALWALIFIFVINWLRDSGTAKKAVPASWNAGGVKEVPLASVVGTVTGKVTASTTGDGLARVTVEAYRVKTAADGTQKQDLSGSAATGDDGTYTLGALLPGKYRFRFSADGFTNDGSTEVCSPLSPPRPACVWYATAADPATPAIVSITPLDTIPGINAVLVGKLATLTGKVAAPPGAATAPAPAVTLTLQPTSADPNAPPAQPIAATFDPVTGTFTAPNLVTPASYTVRVHRDGFVDQTFPVTLAGGQNTIVDTAQLDASNGRISGTTVDGNLKPLGGVKVTLNSGSLTLVSTTPTTGDVGHFQIDNLKTPATYVLTFTLDGYSSVTKSLDLPGGKNADNLTASLIGGAGTVRGTATDNAITDAGLCAVALYQGHCPLGGVKVTVSRGSFSATTTTLTTGGAAGGVGTYVIPNLPVPGIYDPGPFVYNVSFELPTYTSETTSVAFATAGVQVGDAALSPTAGTVTGTASLAGNGVAGLVITLTDGTTTTVRTTQTTASPAGAFLFDQVAPGYYTLTVTGPTINPQVTLIQVAAGQTVTSNIAVTSP